MKQKPSLLEWLPLRPNKLFGNDPNAEKKDQTDDILRALDSIEDEEVRAEALEKLLERLRHKQSLLLENYELEDLRQEDHKVAVCVRLSYLLCLADLSWHVHRMGLLVVSSLLICVGVSYPAVFTGHELHDYRLSTDMPPLSHELCGCELSTDANSTA